MFPRLYIATILSGAALASPYCGATEYRFEPSIYVGAHYDDNLLLSTPAYKSFGLTTSPRLIASASTESWRYKLDTELSFIRLEDDQFSSDNQDINFSAIYTRPKTVWNFITRVDRATTRTTELDSTGVFDILGQRRDAQTFRPVVQWQVAPKHRVTFGSTISNVHYDSLRFDDYDNLGVDINYEHQMNQKTQFTLTGFGGSYNSNSEVSPACSFSQFQRGFFDSGDFASDSYGVQLGFQRQASEQLSYGASAGHRQVSSSSIDHICGRTLMLTPFGFIPVPFEEYNARSADSTGLVMDSNFSYAGESYRVSVTASRSITPAGIGFLIESDRLNLNYTYELSETVQAGVTIIGYNDNAVDKTSDYARDGFRLEPSIAWRFNRQTRISGSLRYRNYNSSFTEIEREGLQVYLGVKYDILPTVISR